VWHTKHATGAAALALHARVTDLIPADLERALVVDKSLLQAWSVRAAPYVVPTRDVVVFTTGLLPENEETLRFFMGGAGPHLDLFGMSASQAVKRTSTMDIVNGRPGLAAPLPPGVPSLDRRRRQHPLAAPDA
jgi:hypothetical protein